MARQIKRNGGRKRCFDGRNDKSYRVQSGRNERKAKRSRLRGRKKRRMVAVVRALSGRNLKRFAAFATEPRTGHFTPSHRHSAQTNARSDIDAPGHRTRPDRLRHQSEQHSPQCQQRKRKAAPKIHRTCSCTEAGRGFVSSPKLHLP